MFDQQMAFKQQTYFKLPMAVFVFEALMAPQLEREKLGFTGMGMCIML